MSSESTRLFGKYRGTVVNILDPERRARLQAMVPDVYGATPGPWAMPSAPFAGPGAGFVAVPPVGAGVWIEFEQGDADFPIWSGCWWGAGAELPVVAMAAQGSGAVTIATASAHISISDAGIVIDNGRGAAVTLTGNRVHITGVLG
jgi:hypothetical protein